MSTVKRVHVYISGKVQGVWFRASTKKIADELNLNGWVRNLPDGRVEAVFEGNPEAIERILEWCWKGPPGARVDKVEFTEEPVEGIIGFSIRY
jgi:acylphosphatase